MRTAPFWDWLYVRHGTKTLIASLEIQTGEVFAHITDTRKSVDFLSFMDDVANKYLGKRLCVILDNLNTHTNAAAKTWLNAHPSVTFHFTPTHASWMNLIESFFSILTKQGLQQCAHTSKRQLTNYLKLFLKKYNERCGPFIWTKGPKKFRRIIELTQAFQKASGIT